MIKVTKKQQDAVDEFKRQGNDIQDVFIGDCDDLDKILGTMSSNQLASAWLGVAEVEPQTVDFYVAMGALKDGKTVYFKGNRYKNKHLGIRRHEARVQTLGSLSFGEQGLFDLLEGDWTIEGE